MKMVRTAVLAALHVLCAGALLADVHYVQPDGNGTSPYTSWITAAHFIQDAIDVASYGDTVKVGSGTYVELIELTPGLALIGVGEERPIIKWQLHSPANYTMIWGADSCIIQGLHLIGAYSEEVDYTNCVGIRSEGYESSVRRISDCRIEDFFQGILVSGEVETEISGNTIETSYSGVRVLFSARPWIMSNTFEHNNQGISMWGAGAVTILGNRMIAGAGDVAGIKGDFIDSVRIENNLIIGHEWSSIYLTKYSGEFETAPIRNNTLISQGLYGVIAINSFSNEISNNVIAGGQYGILTYQAYPETAPYPRVSYNCFWNNMDDYNTTGGGAVDTSLGGNIYSDPMFVGDDDYYLQYGSPCIDSGDPTVKDVDSSRSDMGCYGGLWGESYQYQDLAPGAPDSLSAFLEPGVTVVSWKPNSESDLSCYFVYRSMSPGFIPDVSNRVGEVSGDSSTFVDDNEVIFGASRYYRVSALDETGHEGGFSEELEVMATGVDEEDQAQVRPPVFELLQNQPNPFNSSTLISYVLPETGCQPAAVELNVYNCLGRLVRRLVDARQNPGCYQVIWDGRDDYQDEVASGIYFYRLRVSGLEMIQPKKMLLLR